MRRLTTRSQVLGLRWSRRLGTDTRPADVGWLRRAAGGFRQRDGLTLSHMEAPGYGPTRSFFESPLIHYMPQEGTPNMMRADVGSSIAPSEIESPSATEFGRPLLVGDLVRLTDAVTRSGFAGSIAAAARAGTVGVVEKVSVHSEQATVRLTGYFDHPLGLPMVMERADADAWQQWREQFGPVQRILPTGDRAGPEASALLLETAVRSPPSVAPSVRDLRGELARAVPALEVPFTSLEAASSVLQVQAPVESSLVESAEGGGRGVVGWQPVCGETAARRRAMAAAHHASLPSLRRVSEARRRGDMPLLGFGHGEGFLQPGGETSMAHDAPVIAYDGSGTAREYNLLYIDEEAEFAVVGMGSASGALYSTNVSLRLLQLADVYLPFTRVISPSLPLGHLVRSLPIRELYATSADFGPAQPYFKYHSAPLPPGETSLWGSLRGLFGQAPFDESETAARAWERLRTELIERRSSQSGGMEALQRESAESGSIKLPLELFCLSVGRVDLPVYLAI
jgi:hypothetical protein